MPAKQKAIEVHIPSILGYEKVAMDAAGAVARLMGFHQSKIEDLKTAVSEACINAIEHGNRCKKATMVLVSLNIDNKRLEVRVKDEGKGVKKKVPAPEIEKQINGGEHPRGWGMFLIKQLVDEVEFKKLPNAGHVVKMVVHINQ
jgi:serine/threonine-protein kinase RsbW